MQKIVVIRAKAVMVYIKWLLMKKYEAKPIIPMQLAAAKPYPMLAKKVFLIDGFNNKCQSLRFARLNNCFRSNKVLFLITIQPENEMAKIAVKLRVRYRIPMKFRNQI